MATPDFTQIGGSQEDGSKRSYWSKPEGVTSLLFMGAAGAAALYFWNKIAAFLIEVTKNTLYLGFLMAILALLIFLFTSKDVRTAVFFLFKTLMRNVTGLIIKLDPIAIMKIYIDDLKEKREKMQGQINTLAGQLVKLNKNINENNEQIKQKFAEANKASTMLDRPGMKETASLATIEGAGLQEMNEKLFPLQRNMKTVLEFMEK
jgi:FtsZ-binding cell division protein ZapB